MALAPHAEFGPPDVPGSHTVEGCDEVLRRVAGRDRPAVMDAWLEERLLAMDHRVAALAEASVRAAA